MATQTTNYNLTKPAGDDLAQISVLNGNFDIIDGQMKANADAAAAAQQTADGKQDPITVDDVPTYGSTNPVQSGGVYQALSGKQDELTAGANINIDGNNEISSSHYDVATLADTTSAATIGSGSQITMVDSVTRDSEGHVTKINTKTATFPTIDSALDDTSTHLVQNGVVSAAIRDLQQLTGFDTDDVVGVCIDFENKTFTRLANAVGLSAGDDFDQFTPFGGRRRCNLSDAGAVNKYYGDTGYAEDGSQGQVMVWQPKFYYKVVPLKMVKNTDTTGAKGYKLRKANYFISGSPHVGFKLHPAFVKPDGTERDGYFIGAYEACIYDVSASAYIMDDSQVMDNANDKLSSIAGNRPVSGLTQDFTRVKAEQMAQNRGSKWHGMYTQIAMAEFLLMFVEGAGNLQTVFGKGIVDLASGSGNEGGATGSTASFGNKSGEAESTTCYPGGTATTYNVSGKRSISYRGVENPWGNLWKFVYGINIWGNGTMGGGEPYVCDNPANFAESQNSGNYVGAGFTVANADGYIKAFAYPDSGKEAFDWMLMPNEVGGGADSNLPIGDYFYKTANLNGYRIARLGAYWGDGLMAGLYWYLNNGVGNRYRHVSARLVFAD